MGNFVYFVAASVDGFIATSNDNLDWLLNSGVAGTPGRYERMYEGIGAVVMGGDTYQWMLENAGDEWPYAGRPTWVFTHREFPGIPGANVSFVRGPVAEFAEDFRSGAQGKDVWILGGGHLASQFHDAGLLDELQLTVIPVVLGGGKQLLPHAKEPIRLELLATTQAGPAVEIDYKVL